MIAQDGSTRWRYACVACGAALLLACEGSDGGVGTSRYLAARDETPFCPGAFTPNSEVCYDKTDTDEGPVSTDNTMSEGLLADVEGVDRCLQISVPVPGGPASLAVTFTTTPLMGTYQPRNVGAAWIEDSTVPPQYVRTLEVWAGERVQSITMWYPRACRDKDPTLKAPDVITSATLPQHKTHTETWDGKDFRGAIAPDGKYTLWLQVTESEFVPEGPYIMIPFEKGGSMPWERMATPIRGFADIKLTYTPGAGATDSGSVKP
jgi:hypothetical protein